MFWSQVEKEKKKVEKKSWRKKEKGRFWNEVESREKKKERMEIMGIRVWWRKIKRKEKEKKERKRKRMDDRKKERKNKI